MLRKLFGSLIQRMENDLSMIQINYFVSAPRVPSPVTS